MTSYFEQVYRLYAQHDWATTLSVVVTSE